MSSDEIAEEIRRSLSYLDLSGIYKYERPSVLQILNKDNSKQMDALDLGGNAVNSANETFVKYLKKIFFRAFEDQIRKALLTEERKDRFIYRYLKIVKLFKICSERGGDRAREIYDSYLEILFRFSNDSQLVVDFLQTACIYNFMRKRAFMHVPSTLHLDFILRHAQMMRFDLWGAWCNSEDFTDYCNVVSMYLFRFRKNNLKLVLSYGFSYIYRDDMYTCVWDLFCRYQYNGCVAKPDAALRFRNLQNPPRVYLILVTFQAFFENHFYTQDGSKIQRSNIDCLILFWRSIPDPYVTPSEMYGILQNFTRESYLLELQITCCKYKTQFIFDDSYTLPSPRRLDHYCRCSVRKTLTKCYRLPNGIEELEIPFELKRYLSLDS